MPDFGMARAMDWPSYSTERVDDSSKDHTGRLGLQIVYEPSSQLVHGDRLKAE